MPAHHAAPCFQVGFDATGGFYLASCNSHDVRYVTAAGVISDFAGTGTLGNGGEGGPATSATLNCPFHAGLDGTSSGVIIRCGLCKEFSS